MKKIMMLLVIGFLFIGSTKISAQGNPNPLNPLVYRSAEAVWGQIVDQLQKSMRVINSGYKATGGGNTYTITTAIDSIPAPPRGANMASWCAIIEAVDGTLEWDTAIDFAYPKIIRLGKTLETGWMNKGTILKIYVRRKTGQSTAVTYDVQTFAN